MQLSEAQDLYLKDINAAVEQRLSPRRFCHVVGVVKTAEKFAKRYGLDVYSAKAAAYLHDWDKELSKQDLLALMKEYSLEMPRDIEGVNVYPLLHAWTGAISSMKKFPDLPNEVFIAISKHTTAAQEMSDLDKIIYCADMLEPSRKVKSLDDLRRKSKILDLDELYFLCFKHNFKYLVKHDKIVYPPTVSIWNNLISERKPDCTHKN